MGSRCSTCSYFSKVTEKSNEFFIHDDPTSTSSRYVKDSNEKINNLDYFLKYLPQVIKIQAY